MRAVLKSLAAVGAITVITVGAVGIALANDTLRDADVLPMVFVEGEGVPPRHGYVVRITAPDLAVLDRPADRIANLELDARAAALLLAGLLVLPIVVVRLVRGAALRGGATAPDTAHGPPGPPDGLRPAETAGLLLEHDEDVLFIATLVDLDQRGVVEAWWDDDAYRLQIRRGATSDTPSRTAADVEVATALVGGGPITLAGTLDDDARARIKGASSAVAARSAQVFADHGLLHDRLAWLVSGWFTTLQAVLFGGYAFVLGWAAAAGSPLTLEAAGAVIAVVLAGAHLGNLPWRHQQLPLSPEGRAAVARAAEFRDLVRSATPEQLADAAGRPGIDHLPPAISLLPYAIVFGDARSWYDRFAPQIAGHVAATERDAGSVWWTDHDRFLRAWTALHHTTEEPTRSRITT